MNNIAHLLAKPLLAITPDKELKYGPLHQLGLASLMAGVPVLTVKLMGKSLKSTIPMALGGFTAGLGALPLHNYLVKYKKEQKLNKIKEAISEHMFPKVDPGINIKNIGNTLQKMSTKIARTPDLSKQASIANKIVAAPLKGVWNVTKAVGRGLLPVNKKAPIGEKIFGGVIKGTAITGIGLGTYKGIDYLKKSQPYNYNTHLRNNILYGRIHPSELNASELQEVKQLGWK
jgi:hypothetical protein